MERIPYSLTRIRLRPPEPPLANIDIAAAAHHRVEAPLAESRQRESDARVPAALRRHEILEFDTRRYPFRELVEQMILDSGAQNGTHLDLGRAGGGSDGGSNGDGSHRNGDGGGSHDDDNNSGGSGGEADSGGGGGEADAAGFAVPSKATTSGNVGGGLGGDDAVVVAVAADSGNGSISGGGGDERARGGAGADDGHCGRDKAKDVSPLAAARAELQVRVLVCWSSCCLARAGLRAIYDDADDDGSGRGGDYDDHDDLDHDHGDHDELDHDADDDNDRDDDHDHA